ncbi:MAG: UvrB/UvrC motif-containing protein [Acidobacteria bacterium]|nr:UvrB/UvrC motif-containing protein [Acidobacteriota bacterium]
MLDLDCGQDFDALRDEDFFAALPPLPAVCLIQPRGENAEPLLIRTQDLRKRMQRLLSPPDPTTKRLNLREHTQKIRYRLTGSKFEQSFTYYQNAKHYLPHRYTKMMRLRPPAVLKVTLRNAYPRCIVTRRISVDSNGAPSAGTYYGPFPSRKYALDFGERVLDFFKVRRCQIKIRRDPTFPGCLYSEMKMCLAPCFAGCSKEEYDAEVNRLVQFLDTDGNSLRTAIELEREKASDDLDFERAATIHKRIEKLDDALRGKPDLTRRIQDLNAVILQRSAEDQTIAAFAIRGGRLIDPCYIRFAEIAGQPRSAEQIFRNYLESPPISDSNAAPIGASPFTSRTELGEHLWLLARWYYSNPREGEIFFREKDWPYRKILRACSRLLLPKENEAATAEGTSNQPGANTSGRANPENQGKSPQ